MTSDALISTRAAAPPRSDARRWLASWPLLVALWLLIGAYQGVNAAIGVRNSNVPAWAPFVWEFSSALIVLVLLPLVLRLEARFPIDSKPRSRVLLVHAAGLLAFSAAHTTVMVTLRRLAYALLGSSYNFGNPWLGGFYELQKDVILYATILTVAFAIRSARVRREGEVRAAKLAAEVGEARLRQLTAQIEPHFLFNSLNAISNRLREDVDAADRMIAQLANLLRAAYDAGEDVLVPLRRELAWLRDYTAMMAERFRGTMRYEIDVDPELEDLRVPRLLLQPIVENALRHGLDSGNGWLRVTVRRREARLEYTVSDDGAGLGSGAPTRGTGLSNVARRLELLFPNDHTLDVAPRAPRGTVVTIAFPARA
jgi:signal transduction histidine kinase